MDEHNMINILCSFNEIVEMLSSLRYCQDWYDTWRRDMQREFDAEPIDWRIATEYALNGFKVALYDARRINRELARIKAAVGTVEHPSPTPVLVPERRIEVTNPTHQAILLAMGQTGIGRKWRLMPWIREITGVQDSTIANGFTQLKRAGLIALYLRHGRPVRYISGKRRHALYLLTDDGRAWYENNYGPAAESELDRAIARHKGVQHAIAILEARDLLTALGLEVYDDPQALPLTDDVWGPRAEPDLVVKYDGQLWPVEVQREVRTRNNAKWAKSLSAAGQLVLILETRDKKASQAEILRRHARRLPRGWVRLISLEELEIAQLAWDKVMTG